jgi:predicted S18 family serine protease
MKRLLTLVLLTSCLAIPSFAGDVVGHSVKVAGKDSASAVKVTAKDSAKAVKAFGKFLF